MKRTAKQRAASYKKRRFALIDKLGPICKKCGSTDELELDGINGHRRQPRTMARWNRIKMYEEDFANGNLQVLCSRCNKKKRFQ